MTTSTPALDTALQDALRYFPADLDERQQLLLQEDLRLQLDYPGRYVAYIDMWEDCAGAVTLTRRVLETATTYEDVWDATRGHAEADRVECVYAADPAAAVEPILAD